MKKNNLEKIYFKLTETSIYQGVVNWIRENRFDLFVVGIVFTVLKVASGLPYFNLLLRDSFFVYSPVIVLSILVLDVKTKRFIILSALLFMFALGLWLLGFLEMGEVVGNYIYVILFASVVKGILKIGKV